MAHNLNDFTLWNYDGPIIVKKDFFSVSAVQSRDRAGQKMGTRNVSRANSRASLTAMPVSPQQLWLPCTNIMVGVETGVIVSFKGWTSKQALTLLSSQEMAS
jgi:hypothetical protein